MKKRFALILAAVIALTALLIIPASAFTWTQKCGCPTQSSLGYCPLSATATYSFSTSPASKFFEGYTYALHYDQLHPTLVTERYVTLSLAYLDNGVTRYDTDDGLIYDGNTVSCGYTISSNQSFLYVDHYHRVVTVCSNQTNTYTFERSWSE